MNHCEHFVSSEPGPGGHLEYCSTEVISTVVLVTRMAYSQGKNYSQSGKGAKGDKKRGWSSGWDGPEQRLGAAGSWGGKGKGQGDQPYQQWYGEDELEWAGTESSHKGRLQAQYN